MTTYARTTELEAVNTMLGTIGESPINTLESSGSVRAEVAKNVLHEISRAVQSSAYDFNYEEDYAIPLDVSNHIVVPSNALSIDTTDEYGSYKVTMRGDKVYDKNNKTFVFTQALKFNITFFLPFTDLPEAARNYITIRAARVFQERTIGAQELSGFTTRDEFDAKVTLEQEEGRSGDHNILTGSYDTYQIIDR